jgi:hypothetical protein
MTCWRASACLITESKMSSSMVRALEGRFETVPLHYVVVDDGDDDDDDDTQQSCSTLVMMVKGREGYRKAAAYKTVASTHHLRCPRKLKV